MRSITFKKCRRNPMLRVKAADIIRQKRIAVVREHVSSVPLDKEMLDKLKYVSKLTYNRRGCYKPTHEIIMNGIFERINLSQNDQFADVGGGTWTPALIAAHHVAGESRLIEVDKEVFSLGKKIHRALVSDLSSLRRVKAVCGDYLNIGSDFLAGCGVVYFGCNLSGDLAIELSEKLVDEMDVGALLILAEYYRDNFKIDPNRLEQCYPEVSIQDPDAPPIGNLWTFSFFRKIR